MESTLSQSLSFHAASTPTILIDPQPSRSSSPSEPPQTIKMEEIERSSGTTGYLDIPGTSTLDISASLPAMATSTTTVDQKPPPRKRKSWGQVLPEPKTSLPPRKRAKTADEKEQRRIERVKRNRLAAHNSRERKRQEVDLLQQRAQELEAQLAMMQEKCKQLEAKCNAYEQICPDGASGDLKNLEHALNNTLQNPLQSFQSITAQEPTPRTSPMTLTHSTLTSPDSLLHNIDTPMDSISEPATPRVEAANETDLTQHSAAMLCDLQCRSVSAVKHSTSTQSLPFISTTTAIILLNLRICLMAAISTFLSTTRPSALKRASVASSIPTSRLAWTSLLSRTTSSQTSNPLLTLSSLTCTPAQAQQLLQQLATSQALLRTRASRRRLGSADDGVRDGGWSASFERILRGSRRRKASRVERRSKGTLARDVKRFCDRDF